MLLKQARIRNLRLDEVRPDQRPRSLPLRSVGGEDALSKQRAERGQPEPQGVVFEPGRQHRLDVLGFGRADHVATERLRPVRVAPGLVSGSDQLEQAALREGPHSLSVETAAQGRGDVGQFYGGLGAVLTLETLGCTPSFESIEEVWECQGDGDEEEEEPHDGRNGDRLDSKEIYRKAAGKAED